MRWLVTGGSGFIGTNLIVHLLEEGHGAVIVDDLSRAGSEINADFLALQYHIEVNRIDVSDAKAFESFMADQRPFDAIAHLAGQVSFLASLEDPRRDFEVNALGTLNVLEHVRLKSPDTAVIGMSSNKVYGALSHIRIEEAETRYVAPDYRQGFDESLPLDFHGPYGVSKGIADQYLVDYGRMFGLRTASLRQSSVYGPHQHPRSDQGWVAHLINESVQGRRITLNGEGKQVRDLLHASDLASLISTLGNKLKAGGRFFNVGGGAGNALSILELFSWIEQETGRTAEYSTGPMRPSDQLVFIANTSTVRAETAWEPSVGLEAGLRDLLR